MARRIRNEWLLEEALFGKPLGVDFPDQLTHHLRAKSKIALYVFVSCAAAPRANDNHALRFVAKNSHVAISRELCEGFGLNERDVNDVICHLEDLLREIAERHKLALVVRRLDN